MDDPGIYTELMDTIREFRKKSGWDTYPMRQVVTYAIQYAIGRYFGNHTTGPEQESENQQFYMDRSSVDSQPFSISELKKKGIAVCAEKATTAHNMLNFLSFDSKLIFSNNCKLIETDKNSGHAFVVVKSSRGSFIYDPTNPRIDGAGALSPALFKLTSAQAEEFASGRAVSVAQDNQHSWSYQK